MPKIIGVEWKVSPSLSETELVVPHSRIACFEARMFFEPDIDAFVRAVSGFPWIEFLFAGWRRDATREKKRCKK